MKNILKVDYNNRLIIMDKDFAANSKTVGSDEYNLLQQCRRDYPTFTVTQKHIRKNPQKKAYKGLTYDYMRDYIMYKESENAVNDVIVEFEDMLIRSKCHTQAFRYPIIKKWFLDRYPEIKNFGLSDMDAFKIVKTPVVTDNESDIAKVAA